MSELASTLAPFGIGATLGHLGSGGFPAAKPTRAVPLHGHGLTGGFDLAAAQPGTLARASTSSRSAPSLVGSATYHNHCQVQGASASRCVTPSASSVRSSASKGPWDWDDLRSERSIRRHREAGRMAKMLGQTALAKVPTHTPMGVTQISYYRDCRSIEPPRRG
mmetsp:Transcript_15201/g.40233  ORF Transcript_15201/g.40233 Transcript_15201/m.40233 type:complete len:164 (-) Transcript_15201:69-560(-)